MSLSFLNSTSWRGALSKESKVQTKIEITPESEITPHIIDAFQDVLEGLGFDLGDVNWKETPERFLKYLLHFATPIDYDKIFGSQFPAHESDGESFPRLRDAGMVVQSNIPFKGVCCHHLLPMIGKAAIGYIPTESVIGLSKLTRLVDAVARERPSLQEYYTNRVADLLEQRLKVAGVIVVIHAEHGCMSCRGVSQVGIHTTTSTIRGAFLHNHDAKQEFFDLLKVHSYAG